jgi:hypothetical protein
LVHTPATHIWSIAQVVMQSPQCFGSDVASTHAPAQAVSPALQVSAQRPSMQATVPFATGAHTAPHWPQLFSSAVMSTQVFWQFVWPELQTTVQTLPTHEVPAPHALPQPPQLAESVSRRTQALPQGENGAVQVMPHLLPLHTALPLGGVGQAFPHAPQLPALEVVSTQAALHDMVPVGHRSRHWPPKHVLLAPHWTPQPPQLFGSMLVAMQASPQRVRPALQLKSHAPRAQTATASAGATHALPQAPQFIGSAFSSTQEVPQSDVPEEQVLLQLPAEQLAVPALGLVHAFVHEPQCAESDFKFTHPPLHSVVSPGQAAVHLPSAHTLPDGQLLAQVPQWFGSFFRFTQDPPHDVKPARHVAAQRPD